MTAGPDDWQLLRPLLEELVGLSVDAQQAALQLVARDEPVLAERVARLLDQDRCDHDFLEPPAEPFDPSGSSHWTGRALGPGDEVGAWRLLSPLGAGGMGEVWLAERADGSFEKRVAVKLLRGALVSDEQRARFAAERTLLAGLQHPSIARLLDGGSTADGRPWLAMELVEGLPIDRAAEAAGLSVRQRLKLFCAVCDGVAAAHAALIVHRDLKPDNVLVGADGRPVLLDFGVAKVLDAQQSAAPEITATGQRAFTPSYASPEQLLGRPVGTASDVYSLGVLLYELLVGQRPHDLTGASPTEIVRRLTEASARPPSVVAPSERRRALRGDVDTITAKAMHADPGRRYESARALAQDVQRHLAGLPVAARPDELGYRVGRFVRRHALGIASLALIGALLVVSLVVIMGLLWETEEAREQAERGRLAAARRSAELQALAHGLVFDVYDTVEHLQGASAARTSLLDLVVEALDGLAGAATDSSEAAVDLAQAFQRLGDLQGRPGASSSLDLEAATRSYGQALALLDPIGEPAPARADVLRAEVLGKLAAVERRRGHPDLAAASLDRAQAQLDLSGDPADGAALALRQAEFFQDTGRSDEALAACDRAEQLLDASARVDLGRLRLLQMLAWRRGQILRQRRELDAATLALDEAVQIAEVSSRLAPADGQALRDLGLALGERGSLWLDLGRVAEAAEPMARQLLIFERLAGTEPDDVVAQLDLALAFEKRAEWQLARGERQAALDDRRQALALDTGLVARGLGGRPARSRVGHDELLVSDVQLALGQQAAALASARRAIAVLAELQVPGDIDVVLARDLLVAQLRVGEVSLAQEQLDQALAAFERGHALADELVTLDPHQGPVRRLRMVSGYFLAVCQQALGRQLDEPVAARQRHLALAAELYKQTQQASARLAELGMLEPGDEEMAPVLETERRACLDEAEALAGS